MNKRLANELTIIQSLRMHGQLAVSSLATILALSEPTIRRYLDVLEQRGEVIRVHGGAMLAPEKEYSSYLFHREKASMPCEKYAIGLAAAQDLNDGDRIFFDSGTTVLECGQSLQKRLENKEIDDIYIVTNSLAFGATFAQNCPVLLTGGNIRADRMDLAGPVALENLERYNFSKAVLGADAVSADGELATTDEDTSLLAAAVLKRCSSVMILVDSKKLGKKSFVPYTKMQGNKFTLYTDDGADAEIVAELRDLEINVNVVKVQKRKNN
jgi:DeoR family fructose operon transcriptional repressor